MPLTSGKLGQDHHVKIWPHDPWVNCMPNKTMKDYLKIERSLVDDKKELIEKAKYFEDLNVDGDQQK